MTVPQDVHIGAITTGSAILDTPATSAHEMHGCIHVAYKPARSGA